MANKMKIRPILIWAGVMMAVAVLVGAILNLQMRDHFVQVSPNVGSRNWAVLTVLAIPILLVFWFVPSLREGVDQSFRTRVPTRFLRVALFFPFGAYICAYAIATAPAGYLYLWGYFFGDEVLGVKATVVDVEPLRTYGKGCRQKFVLSIDGRSERVCVEDRVSGPMPKLGQIVQLRCIVSPVGLWVKEVRIDQ